MWLESSHSVRLQLPETTEHRRARVYLKLRDRHSIQDSSERPFPKSTIATYKNTTSLPEIVV